MKTNMPTIPKSALLQIYGTDQDLENQCNCANECWKNYDEYKTGENQVLYHPFVGSEFKGILFSGINLNGAVGTKTAIENLVEQAVEKYLKKKKYNIFKNVTYRGSPFYYYVPLLAKLYQLYTDGHCLIEREEEISFEQIIEGFRYCKLTNLIKCSVNSPDNRSTPSEAMYRNCTDKFHQELEYYEYNVLVVFTYYKCPFLSKFLGIDTLVHSGERYKINTDGKIFMLELEHPSSTQVTRKEKFMFYSDAIYNVVKLVSAYNRTNQLH